MIAYVIKFNNGTFYAGCNKPNAKTLLGAQLYKSEKTAINVINKSVNFHASLESCFLVKVKLEEIKPMKTIEEIRQELHKQGYGYEPIIDYCIERGYLSFYPPNNNSSGLRNESGSRNVPRMTQEDYEKEAEHLAELEAQGVQVRF